MLTRTGSAIASALLSTLLICALGSGPLIAGAFPDSSPASETNGDVNGDETIDISDVIYLLMWRFSGGAEPVTLRCERPALENGDVNGDRLRDISDAIYLLSWRFSGGPAPRPGCDTSQDPDVHADHEEDTDNLEYLDGSGPPQSVGIVPEAIRNGFRPLPIYKLRVHAIRTANNDGSQAATITPGEIQLLVEQANVVFFSAGIELQFDPARDFEHQDATVLNHHFTMLVDPADYTDPDEAPPTEPKWNTAFRNATADLHRGKIVVYFSYGGKLAFDEGLGHWTVVASGGGSSSWYARFVSMPKGMPEKNLLAHELGHYLHNGHTFVGGVETVADAAERIRKYVEDGGHPVADGLEALDGDRDFVLDTPADTGGQLLEDLYGDRCGPNGSVNIPVGFRDGTRRTYVLESDRHLIMSYFKTCYEPGQWFSPQQVSRHRDALENGNHHDLVTMSSSGGYAIDRLGSADAGGISACELVRVSFNRLVTVVITGGNLKLIAWDVSADGKTITRRGEHLAGPVSRISAVHMGLGIVATAVRISDGTLKVIVWKVTASGEIERHGEAKAGAVDQISACRLGVRYVATAVRDGDGNLQVILWHVRADGTIARMASNSAGRVNEISAATLGTHGVLTAIRDSQNTLKLISWIASNDAKKLLRHNTVSGETVSSISATHVAIDVLTTAVRLTSGAMRLITWRVDEYGVITRRDQADAGAATETASTRMGTGLLVTARSDAGGQLALDLWGCTTAGGDLVHKSDGRDLGASQISLARAGEKKFATAFRTSSGTMRLVSWELLRVRVLP